MNKEVLNDDFQDFIIRNESADAVAVSLGRSPFPGISPQEIAQQLSGRKKAAAKLPLWHRTRGIYYPPSLNLEQASSEEMARYKAGMAEGEVLVDLTGGFGVDSSFFSRRFRKVHYCEQDPDLAAIAAHNFKVLGAENIRVHVGNGIDLLGEIVTSEDRVDWIYLDPSRRKSDRTRVFRLEDCLPPLPGVLPELFRHSPDILIKTSPMLDIAGGVRNLGHVREVHAAGLGNEMRELLWWVQKGDEGPAVRTAVDLSFGDMPVRFTAEQESGAGVKFSLPATYLYEPNAALLKAGGFNTAAVQFGLFKIHRLTHLYTSDTLIPFPGRRFRILQVIPYKPGKLPFKKANVSVRNFPESVARIRKRNRIDDGGDTFLFFVRAWDESLQVLHCESAGHH